MSWYEAAAYAKFAEKSLPTIFHWAAATYINLSPFIIPFSNFGNQGPRAVASGPVGPKGTFDMAGNVKEWCWNASKDQRMILGGGWDEPNYMYYFADAQSPFDRSRNYGFRCIRNLEDGDKTNLTRPVPLQSLNITVDKPVLDEVFEAYKRRYAYDPADLESVAEPVDESFPYWTRQRITFRATYGNDRVIAYLFLPKNGTPPFQTVIYFPGINARADRSVDSMQLTFIDFILKSGRAVMYPIYKGTHERSEIVSAVVQGPKAAIDNTACLMNDLRRSVDYLQTRKDIDLNKLAYYGFSWGGRLGPIALALEKRFRLGILLDGGILPDNVPELYNLNFAPRVDVPVLMINGKNDSLFPVETRQRPLYDLLGTPKQQKKWVKFESGHAVLTIFRSHVIKEILDWLDQYFGKA